MTYYNLAKCAECKWEYPDELLSQIFVGNGYTPPTCGLCALDRINRELDIKRTHFHGEMAEDMRVRAAQWRNAHPEHKPTKSGTKSAKDKV